MGEENLDTNIAGAKNPSSIPLSISNPTPPPHSGHISISLPHGSGLSLNTDDNSYHILMLETRNTERDQELTALRAEMAQVKTSLARSGLAKLRSGGRRHSRRSNLLPPPLLQTLPPSQYEHMGPVHDHIGPSIEDGGTRDLVVFWQPTTSMTRRSDSGSRGSCSRRFGSTSLMSSYSIAWAKYSNSTYSRVSTPSWRRPEEVNSFSRVPPRFEGSTENTKDGHNVIHDPEGGGLSIGIRNEVYEGKNPAENPRETTNHDQSKEQSGHHH